MTTKNADTKNISWYSFMEALRPYREANRRPNSATRAIFHRVVEVGEYVLYSSSLTAVIVKEDQILQWMELSHPLRSVFLDELNKLTFDR